MAHNYVIVVAIRKDSVHASGKAIVADLNRAIIIKKDVSWFEVSVNDLFAMQVLETT